MRGLAGVALWALDLDDFKGTCGQGNYPLVTTVKNAFSNFSILKQQSQKRQQPDQSHAIPRRRRPRRDVTPQNGNTRNDSISSKKKLIKVSRVQDVVGHTPDFHRGLAAPSTPKTPDVIKQTTFDQPQISAFGGTSLNPLAASVRSRLIDVKALVRYDFEFPDPPSSKASHGNGFMKTLASLAADFISVVKTYIAREIKSKVTRNKRSLSKYQFCVRLKQ